MSRAIWKFDHAYCGHCPGPAALTRLAPRPGWVKIGVHWKNDEQAGYLRHLGKRKVHLPWPTNISASVNRARERILRSDRAPFEAEMPINMKCPRCQTVNEVADPNAMG